MNSDLNALSVCLCKSHTVFPLFKCHPFYWLDNGPAMNVKWRARLRWYVSVSLVVLYYAYVVGLTAKTVSNPTTSLAVKFYMMFSTVAYSFGVFNHGFVIISNSDFTSFTRNYIKMLGEVTKYRFFNPDSECWRDYAFSGNMQFENGFNASAKSKFRLQSCRLLMMTIRFSCWAVVVANTLLNVARPTSHLFLSSLITTNSTYFETVARPIAIAFQVYLLTAAIEIIPLVESSFMLFVFTMPILLQHLVWVLTIWFHECNNLALTILIYRLDVERQEQLKPNATKVRCKDYARIENVVHRYRCFQLISIAFNSVYTLYNALLHAAATGGISILVFGAIRGEGLISILSAYLGLQLLLGYLLVISTHAEISRLSKCVLLAAPRAWSRASGQTRIKNVAGEILKRKLVTMVELHVKAASFFYFDKPLVLSFANVVFILSANLLIMY